MQHDHIIIGSGLAALAAALGSSPDEKVLVLAGEPEGRYRFYNALRAVPCAFTGYGGLGNDWHGVIPMRLEGTLTVEDFTEFTSFFGRFFPHAPVSDHAGRDAFFVPWQPIRPHRAWSALQAVRGSNLAIVPLQALQILEDGSGAAVRSGDGQTHRARHVWVAAGCLQTPFLLDSSFGPGIARDHVSDHALCYVGMIGRRAGPRITRHREGAFFEAFYGERRDTLYTLRPARFEYRRLDHGIEQRAVFGMPTGSAVRKIARRLSPGLLVEAFFNRFALFPQASCYSVYGQTAVRDAYTLRDAEMPITARIEVIAEATQSARERAPFADLQPSRRNDLYIPGIHLYHSVHVPALKSLGINEPGGSIQVVDASVIEDIGPEHPSFNVMFKAFKAVAAVAGA